MQRRRLTPAFTLLVFLVEVLAGVLLAYGVYRAFPSLHGFLAVKIYPFFPWPEKAMWFIFLEKDVPRYLFLYLCVILPVLLHGLIGRRWTRLPGPPTSARLLRTLGWLVFAVCLAGFVPCVVAASWLGADYLAKQRRAPYASTFNQTCASCHGPERPLGYVKSPVGWANTVERMTGKNPQAIPAAEAEEVRAYLTELRSYTGRDLYRAKCLPCHLGSGLSRKAAGTFVGWEGVLDRIHRQNAFFLTVEQLELLLPYLETKRKEPGKDVPATIRAAAVHPLALTFEEKCGRCHSLKRSIAVQRSTGQWESFLTGHRSKSPFFLDGEAVSDEFAGFLNMLGEQGSEWFAHLFPHDVE